MQIDSTFIIISVFKMQERHDILSQTIGYHKEEQEALDRGYYLLYGSFTFIIIGSLLEIWFFWIYNGPWHPFANILKDQLCVNKHLPRQMKNIVNGSLFLSEKPRQILSKGDICSYLNFVLSKHGDSPFFFECVLLDLKPQSFF